MIEETSIKPNHKKLIILSSIVVALLVLLVVIFQPNTTGVITREIRKLLSLEGNPQEEVKSIELTSNDYDGEGSWKVTKSAKWLAKDEAQIDIEVESVLKRRDAKYKDIIFVLDVSGSMDGSKIEQVKNDATDLINYLMTPEEGEEVGNTAALITFSDDSTIKHTFINNKETLIQDIQEITVGGNTNYNKPLLQVDEVMEDYVEQANHDAIVFFLTDGLPNEDTPNQIGTYRMLKEKYPYLIISGVQYEMGSTVVEEIKQISDEQYSTDMKTLRNAMYEIATRPIKYDKFYLEDIINDDYFNVESMSDITSTKGETSLQPTSDNKQKVIWSINNTYVTGEKETLTIKIKLKDEFVDNEGFYKTNNSTKVIYRLPETEDAIVSTIDSPVLTNRYKVIYDTNTPEGCTLPSIPEEEYYIYSRVDQKTEELVCDGYVFDGYQTDSNDEKDIIRINDNTFLMPAHDVTIRGTWSKVSITKSMEGTIHEKKTLYKVLEDEAAIGTYAKKYAGYHQDNFNEEVQYTDDSPEWETRNEFVSGITGSDIIKIEDGSSYPFSYNEKTLEWSSTNQNKHSTRSSITFKIDTSKLNGVPLHYKVSSESNYDKLTIKVDGVTKVNGISGEQEGDLDLSDITNDTVIEVSYSKDSSASKGTDTATFSMANYKEVTNYIGNGKPKIYHWYAEKYTTQGNNNTNIIKNKNNVLFANHCWQMIRTTDTGGVKMIYNGEAENGKCLTSRDKHEGYNGRTYVDLTANYLYGTDYTYDKDSKTFNLSGDFEQSKWNDSTWQRHIGKYTCASTSSTTCSTLYYIESYKDESNAYVLSLNTNSNYSEFGNLQFNQGNTSISSVGYMNNIKYGLNNYVILPEEHITSINSKSSFYNYYYSENYTYENGKYVIPEDSPIITSDNVSEIVGKYITTEKKTTNWGLKYAIGIDSRYIYYIYLRDGEGIDDVNDIYTYGSNYIDNGNGTYTIIEPKTINKFDYFNTYKTSPNTLQDFKYVCKNEISGTCTELYNVYYKNEQHIVYFSSNNKYMFSNSFEYKLDQGDGKYKYYLNEESSQIVWDLASTSINNTHYTCKNLDGKCESITYYYGVGGNSLYYVNLTNGKSVIDILNEMLYNDDVNAKNSIIKTGVDLWYKKNIYDNNYDEYIEDTIYCNNRDISNKNENGWNPNGGSIFTSVDFDHTTMMCKNETDKFSTLNNKAKLDYKVGLLTDKEYSLLGNSIIYAGNEFWFATPDYFDSGWACNYCAECNGSMVYNDVNYKHGVRPVISLKPGMEYTQGDGSMEHPYYIETEVDSG